MSRLSGNSVNQLGAWFGGGFGILWLLFWSAITCAFDGVWLWMLATQALTWTYAATEGTVLESRIEQAKDSDGDTTFDAKIAYEYAAGGRKHRGETIRHLEMRMNGGRQQAQESVQRFPVGKRVTVYFDPDRPAKSVLERDLRGGDFFLPLFMMPFNVIMLGGWYAVFGSWRKRGKPAGIQVRDDGLTVTARIYDVTPLAAAVVAVMASSFVLIFVCGFGMLVLPVDWLVPAAWCIVLGSAIIAWSRFRQPTTTFEYDHFSSRVSITKSDGQSHAFKTDDVIAVGRELDPEEVECVDEDDEEDEEDDDDDGEPDEQQAEDSEATIGNHHPTITYRDSSGQEQTVALAKWSSGDSVTWLVQWLKETLRLKPQSIA